MNSTVKTFVKSPASFLIAILLFVLGLLFVLRLTSKANNTVHVDPEANSIEVVETSL